MLGLEILGLEIIESPYCADVQWLQYRFPRSRKRRIRRKWAQQRRNYRVTATPWNYALRQGGRVVVCHPAFAGELRELLAAKELA